MAAHLQFGSDDGWCRVVKVVNLVKFSLVFLDSFYTYNTANKKVRPIILIKPLKNLENIHVINI